MDHAVKALETVAEDVAAYVKAHPQYGELVARLGENLIAQLAANAGL